MNTIILDGRPGIFSTRSGNGGRIMYVKLSEAAKKFKITETDLLRAAEQGEISLYCYSANNNFIKLSEVAAKEIFYNDFLVFPWVVYGPRSGRAITPNEALVRISEIENVDFSKEISCVPTTSVVNKTEKLKIALEILEAEISRDEAKDKLESCRVKMNVSEILTSIFNNHGEEVTIANECSRYLYGSGKNQTPTGGHGKLIMSWLDKHKKKLGAKAKTRILHLVNPNPKGGNPGKK